jgi:hypothetical protein
MATPNSVYEILRKSQLFIEFIFILYNNLKFLGQESTVTVKQKLFDGVRGGQ